MQLESLRMWPASQIEYADHIASGTDVTVRPLKVLEVRFLVISGTEPRVIALLTVLMSGVEWFSLTLRPASWISISKSVRRCIR